MRGFAAPVFQNILRHPDADYRLPPVIVLSGRLVVVFVDVISSGNAGAGVVLFVYMVFVLLVILSRSASASVLYYYAEVLPLIYLLGISRLFFFSAFGENFGPTGASGSARPPLSTVTTAWTVRAVRREKSGQPYSLRLLRSHRQYVWVL